MLGYARQRLDQNSILEGSVTATDENYSSLDFTKKSNFLADQRKKTMDTFSTLKSLKTKAKLNKTGNQFSAGLLLRETSQERNLAKMKDYE